MDWMVFVGVGFMVMVGRKALHVVVNVGWAGGFAHQ
jgi:hypothetical protein